VPLRGERSSTTTCVPQRRPHVNSQLPRATHIRRLRLVADQLDAQLARQRGPCGDLLGVPLGDADVERLAGPHQVGEGGHRLLERNGHVVPVCLVEVDVVRLEPAQRGVTALDDVLAGEPSVVVSGTGRPVDLREHLERFTPLPGERAAEHRLGTGAGIDVSGVEGRDARVEGGTHAGVGGVLLDLAAVGEPVAVGDLGDGQAGTAESSEFHVTGP